MTALSVNTALIQTLGSALRRHQAVALHTSSDGSQKIKPLGILSRIWYWGDKKFHEERFSHLAAVVARVLTVQQRLSIEAASHDPTLVVGRRLLKQIHAHKYHTPAIESLKKQVIAAKLGINAVIFDRNPGLQQFVERNHLERYLLHYGHSLAVNANTGEASLYLNREITPWSKISEEIKTWAPFTHSPQQHWFYGPEGIHHRDMYQWTKLEPYKKEDPSKWHHQYIFEVCACYNPESAKEGNHSWIRLKTPSGDIYSVGLYRPGKSGALRNLKAPFRTKPAYLMQPDVSEFWDFKISNIAVTINEDIFNKIKQTIEEDKAREDELVFHTINSNCLLYCKKLGALANIDLPTRENLICSVLSQNIVQKMNRWVSYLPQCIQKVCYVVGALFVNLGHLLLGSNQTDNSLNDKQKAKATPQIRTFRDLFDIEKTRLDHPSTFSFQTVKNVLHWRERKIAETMDSEHPLETREEKIRKINHSLPPEYYVVNRPLA